MFPGVRKSPLGLSLASTRKSQCSQRPNKSFLEVLLAPDETVRLLARVGVHIAFDMQLRAETFRSAEEDTTLAGAVDLFDSSEDHVPVGTAEVGGRAQAGDGIGVAGVEHDVGGLGGCDFGG